MATQLWHQVAGLAFTKIFICNDKTRHVAITTNIAYFLSFSLDLSAVVIVRGRDSPALMNGKPDNEPFLTLSIFFLDLQLW